jgi:hypothetical protein
MGFPATFNILYYRGDTYEFVIQPKNADGTAFNLTNYPSASSKFTVASRAGATDTFVFNGDVACTISSENGQSLVQGTSYVYDVQIRSASSTFTLVAGGLSVTNDISGRVT